MNIICVSDTHYRVFVFTHSQYALFLWVENVENDMHPPVSVLQIKLGTVIPNLWTAFNFLVSTFKCFEFCIVTFVVWEFERWESYLHYVFENIRAKQNKKKEHTHIQTHTHTNAIEIWVKNEITFFIYFVKNKVDNCSCHHPSETHHSFISQPFTSTIKFTT